jgi:hypothetical protein
MTNLMCRGRKRGLAGVIATQRLAKLAKNVAAEASNFLMGRTFLDIDMARAADLLGMERRQAEQIRDLERGHFIGLGPAIARRPVPVRIGAVRTATRSGMHGLMPMPQREAEAVRDTVFAALDEAPPAPRPDPRPAPVPAEDLIPQQSAAFAAGLAESGGAAAAAPRAAPVVDEAALAGHVQAVLAEMLEDPDSSFQPLASLYRDFTVRCRMRQMLRAPLDLSAFRRRFALAQAGILDPADPRWADMLAVAARLPEDMLAPFALIARAAMDGQPCPDDDSLGRVYGSSSSGRIRRLIDYMEKQGAIVVRTDFGGRRSIIVPELGVSAG